MSRNSISHESIISDEKIRVAWHKDEWYYSVVDIIAKLLAVEQQKAVGHWANFRRYLSSKDYDNFPLAQLKAEPTEECKYMIWFTNLDGVTIIDSYLQANVVDRLKRPKYPQGDEVTYFHPKVVRYLQKRGWLVTHQVRLKSGNIIDMIAISPDKTMVVECKPELSKVKFFSAIGQVLCYTCDYNSQYGVKAVPAIATFQYEISEYMRQMCNQLNIELFAIKR